MRRDSKAFRERFLRWKAGEAVYDNGKPIEHYADGTEPDALRTAAPIRNQYRLTILDLNRAIEAIRRTNTALISSAQYVPKQLEDYYRNKQETEAFMARKRAGEQAADEMMAALIDPRYIAAGGALGAMFKGIKGAITGSKLYKAYKLSKAINKEVKNLKVLEDTSVPGQIGWAPKTTVSGYHASNEGVLNPDFWFNGWAQLTHGAPHGFYIAGGNAPEGGFLAKRPYVHQVEATFDKPMVQVGDIRTTGKNNLRNQIEREAQSMGADGIIYQDIRDNQLSHQHIAKTLNPDVNVQVRPNSTMASEEFVNAEEVGPFGGEIQPVQRTRGRKVNSKNGIIYAEPRSFKYDKTKILPPKRGADAFVDSEGNVNMHNLANAIKRFYKKHPEAEDFREIKNRGLGGETNLWQHIRDVVRSAQLAPVPEGFTRQDLVQAALFHDIGKVINGSYSGHAQASLDILDDMGILVSPEIRRAIKVHMRGSSPDWTDHRHGSIGEESPLARALHFVDVVRNKTPMSNEEGGAFYEYRNLLYPTKDQYLIKNQYTWDTDYQLKNIINPILELYDYKPIELGLPEREARRQLISRIQAHRRFVRGQHGLGEGLDENTSNTKNAIEQFVRREGRYPTVEDLYRQGLEYYKEHNTNSGTRGGDSYMHKMDLPWKHYMTLYTSNSSDVPQGYRRSSSNPLAIGALEMPVLNNPEWSLAELWGYNDFPLTYSPHSSTSISTSQFNSEWRNRILPYVLDNGTGGLEIKLNSENDRSRFMMELAGKLMDLARREYSLLPEDQKSKKIMPSDIEPSDFIQGIVGGKIAPLTVIDPRTGNEMVYYDGRPSVNHFYPFDRPVPFNPALGNPTPQVNNTKVTPYGDYTEHIPYNIEQTLRKYLDYTEDINKVLRQYGLPDFSPVAYSRLKDNKTILKYPRALGDLYGKLRNPDINEDIPAHIPIRYHPGTIKSGPHKGKIYDYRTGLYKSGALPREQQYLGMTEKQIKAHNDANRIKYVDGIPVNTPIFNPETGSFIASNTKYVPDKRKVVLKYLNEYFLDIRKAKSKDAFVRRAVAEFRNDNLELAWVDSRYQELMAEIMKKYDAGLFEKDYLKIPKEYQHPFPFPLWSRDGYRVFVTENRKNLELPVSDRREENYIFVGKRGDKALKLNEKFNFDDGGKWYTRGRDYIGNIYPGLTKNAR